MRSSLDPLLDRAPCGFVSFGDDSAVTLINATLLERLGYRREEVVGRHVEQLFTVGGRIFHQTHLFPLIKLHGRAQEVFLMLQAKSGEHVGMICNAVRSDRDGLVSNDCIFMEVQERRKFEEALLEAKRAAERARAELAVQAAELEEANSMLREQAVELEEHQELLQEQAVELEAQGENLRRLNDELLSQASELERQRAIAEEANRAKSSFLAVMSHELRTPLNAIGGYVQILEMGVHGPVTPAQQDALARIDRSQRHLLRLINDILNLARIESGRVEYDISVHDAAEILDSVIPMVEPQIVARRLTFWNEVPRGLRVKADREKAQQVVLNLLTNAVKFTEPEGRVTLDAGHDADGSRVFLRVTDTGRGIKPNMLDRIFEPFIQVDASHTRAGEGTGLGLGISRDLARGMGGDLTAKSTFGQGSAFTFTLPSA